MTGTGHVAVYTSCNRTCMRNAYWKSHEMKIHISLFFSVGDERLVLHEKTFLSRLKSTVLYEAEGGVQNIKWNAQFVAWASDIGVRVYDINARCSLGLIKWNRNPE